jgi:hypothetical protein
VFDANDVKTPPLKVQTEGQLQHTTMVEMKHFNLSTEQVNRAAQVIRQAPGNRRMVQSWLANFLYSEGQRLADFFAVEDMEFRCKQNSAGEVAVVKRPVVFCCNLQEFTTNVARERGIHAANQQLKVGIDGGGGSLKICINITGAQENSQSTPAKKPGISNRFHQDSGVKKLLIVAIAEDLQENYHNLKVMLSAINIASVRFSIACDFKLANILAGIQSHASAHPCCYCDGRSPWNSLATDRTLGAIRRKAEKFQEAGGRLSMAKNFANCVHPPLLPGADHIRLIDLVPPPELHIMLGVVNKIFDELNTRWGENRAYSWAHDACIVRDQYHGGCLEGPACKKLLQKAEELRNILPRRLRRYASALKEFDLVRLACFGDSLNSDFETRIHQFKATYTGLGLSVTPKLHVLFHHVPEFCSRRDKGLGSFSEQATESAHSDFRTTWQRYQRPLNHPQYRGNLLQAVVNYNSFHI